MKQTVRPKGWNANNDVPLLWRRAGYAYRGMTAEEFAAHLKAGYVKSTGRYSHSSEGTCFSDDPRCAEGYVNFGRDDPRKSGVETYVIEVSLSVPGFYRDRDDYWKSRERIPLAAVSRVWRMRAEGGAVVAERVGLARGRKQSGASKKPSCKLRHVGLSTGTACERAKFKPWLQREIRRLYKRTIMSKSDSASAIRAIVGTDMSVREHIVGLALDEGNRVIGVADGTSNEKSVCAFNYGEMLNTLYESAEIMTKADSRRIKRIMIGHNHPSGDAQASPEDIRTTKHLVERACDLGGHPLVEHIIVSPSEYEKPYPGARYIFSMRDEYGESMFGGQPCMDKHEYITWDDL